MKSLSYFTASFVVLWAVFGGAYFLATQIANTSCLFPVFEGSSSYHCVFPYQYLALGSGVCSAVYLLWSRFVPQSSSIFIKIMAAVLALLIILLVCSFLGGILWATHDILVEQSWRNMSIIEFYWFHVSRFMYYSFLAVFKIFPIANI